MNIANRSSVETEYLLEVALELGYLSQAAYGSLENLRFEAGIVLTAFAKTLRNKAFSL
ncbi:MAG: four helix bundle protein [Candidatus Omnitrophica bacterium]|nr:four helix bundle protein [Candidatus Omnitrophota bacterium]